jgi:hypothetical protein
VPSSVRYNPRSRIREEVVAAEQEDLTEGENALLELLNRKLRRELKKAA